MNSLREFKILDEFHHLNESLHRLDWNNKLAVATSSERVQNDRLISKFVHCFDEPNHIRRLSLKIFMRKDFPLRNELNRFIERVTEGGLIEKWENIRGAPVEKPPTFSYTEITLKVFLNIAYFSTGMVLIAVFTLLCERFVHKKARAPGAPRRWRYIEMMIDPFRYLLLNDLSY